MGTSDSSILSSLSLTWTSFSIGVTFVALHFFLLRTNLATWYDDDLTDRQVGLIDFALILFGIGLILLLSSMNRLLVFQPNYYPRELTIAFLISCIIACVVIGFIYFFDWDGVSLITMNTSETEAGVIVTSIYLFLLCMILFIVLSFILLRMCLFCIYYDSDEYNDGILNNNLYNGGINNNNSSNYTSMADKEPLLGGSSSSGGGTSNNTNDTGVIVEEKYDTLETQPPAQRKQYGSVDLNERNKLAIMKNNSYYNSYDKFFEYSSIILFFVIFLPLLLFFNGIFPSDWDGASPSGIEYFNESVCTAGWTINISYVWNGATYYLKIFGDLIVYFGFIVIVSLVSWFSMKNIDMRMLLRRRIISLYSGPIEFSMSLGQFIFWILWGTLMFVEMYYWLGVHEYDYTSDLALGQIWARTFGILAIIFLSFMMFTVTRIRLWTDVFGLSSDHLIKLHRIFGFAMIICCYFHMFAWIIWFATNDTGYTLDDNFIFVSSLPFTYNESNWTVAMAEVFLIFFVPIVYFVFSNSYIRRNCFELFYIIHLFGAIVFISFMFWHATQTWRYLVPPLTLYIIDRCLRFYNSTNFARIENIDTINIGDNDQVVTLSVSVAKTGESDTEPGAYFGKLTHKMGQYCYIYVPNVSAIEWHPFTISSSPYDRYTTFHIKSMGQEQFSGKLCALARNYGEMSRSINSGDDIASLREIELHIDGPYGIGFDYDGYDRIVLVAGGIGITPCHSIFKSLLTIAKSQVGAKNNSNKNVVPLVHLIWMVRDPDMFDLFSQTWKDAAILENSSDFVFSVSFYHTRATGEIKMIKHESSQVTYKNERPNLVNALSFIKDDSMNDKNTLVFCCGPTSLSDACEKVATQYGVHYYSESFDFNRGNDIKLGLIVFLALVIFMAIMGAIVDRY